MKMSLEEEATEFTTKIGKAILDGNDRVCEKMALELRMMQHVNPNKYYLIVHGISPAPIRQKSKLKNF